MRPLLILNFVTSQHNKWLQGKYAENVIMTHDDLEATIEDQIQKIVSIDFPTVSPQNISNFKNSSACEKISI